MPIKFKVKKSYLLKKVGLECISKSTFHGLPKIFTSQYLIIKFMWLLLTLLVTSYCIWSILCLLNVYLNFNTYISTKIIQEIPTKFPAVTFCNMKTINKTKNYDFLYSLIEPLLSFDWSYYYPQPFLAMLGMLYTMRKGVSNLNDTKKAEDMGYQLESMLFSCFFNSKRCHASDFTFFYDTLRGNCYTFNKGIYDNGSRYDVKNVSIAYGSYTGLVLELYLGDISIETAFEYDDGVILSIHNQTSVPFTDGLILKASANTETDFVVNRNFITKLGYPYGNCQNSNINKSYLGIKYNQKYCFSVCIQNLTVNTCNCSNLWLPIIDKSTNICYSEDDIQCMVNFFHNINTDQDFQCSLDCPLECETIEYSVSTLTSLYPTDYYAKFILPYYYQNKFNNTLPSISYYRSFAKINIYYEKLQYTKTSELASMTLPNLVANIGGYMGLCGGISFLSVCEVFEFALLLVKNLKTNNKIKKKDESADQK